MISDDFLNKIGYTFNNPKLKEQALTRSEFASEMRVRGEECLDQIEFKTLGDAVLKLAIILILREKGITSPGEITIRKSNMENETCLAQLALRMNIWPDIRKDSGEESRGAESQPGLMAETLEALIGAMFLDSNLESVTNVLSKWYQDDLNLIKS
jgi:ribonuclease-3